MLGYLALCIAAGVILEAITNWPIGSMIIVIAVFYVLLVFLGAAILRPIATMTMMVFKGAQRENRRDTGRPGRRGTNRIPSVPSVQRGRRIRRGRDDPDGTAADAPPPP